MYKAFPKVRATRAALRPMTRRDIIRETAINSAVVTTERLHQRYLCRPYQTAVKDHGFETCVGFFASQGAADQRHNAAVKNLSDNSGKGTTNAKRGL